MSVHVKTNTNGTVLTSTLIFLYDFFHIFVFYSFQLVYNRSKYNYRIYFHNSYYGELQETGGKPTVDNQKYVVRRLSTSSFADRKTNEDGFFTQWRWYSKVDQDWIIFDKVRK